MDALLIGDSHGNLAHVKATLSIAKENGYPVAIHLGDYGWWPTSGENQFIKLTDEYAKELGLPFWIIDGNHDFPGEDDKDKRGYRAWRLQGPELFEPGLKWIPRSTVLKLGKSKVMFLGGAASVDKKFRTVNVDWWRDELFTDEDVAKVKEAGAVDVLLSHDRYNIPKFFQKLWFGHEVEEMLIHQIHKWSEILTYTQPSLHVHGHFHVKYEEDGLEWPNCHTVGLAHEDMNSFCGINFDTLKISWPELPEQLKVL